MITHDHEKNSLPHGLLGTKLDNLLSHGDTQLWRDHSPAPKQDRNPWKGLPVLLEARRSHAVLSS